MDSIVTSVVPLFSAIFLGFAAGKLGAIGESGVRGLIVFVFSFAMPALIFRLMANTDIGTIDDWPVISAYVAAQLPIFLGALMIGGWLFRQTMSEMTIQAFGSSFSNGVVLGFPLVLSLYGDRAAVPALLIIMLDIVVFGVITLLLEIARLRAEQEMRPRPLVMLRNLSRSVFGHPLILASLLGIGFGASTLTLPGALDKTLEFLGEAAPPAGLFALGAMLGLRQIGGQSKPVAAMISTKLLLHPLLAALVVTSLFTLDPIATYVVILFAACPVGANVFVFAAHYRASIETSATAVLLSTAIALISLSWLTWYLSPIQS